MLKRISAALAGLLVTGAVAYAANLPLITGAQDPSQLNATINTLIQSINSGVGGLLNAQTAAVATGTGTTEQTLQSYTTPPGIIGAAGQTLRITCWGVTGANANNKTMKLYFGASSIATPTAATNAKGWRLVMNVMNRTATTQGIDSWGLVDTTAVTPANTDGAETLTAGVLIKCTGTDGTSSASDITASGMTVELVK